MSPQMTWVLMAAIAAAALVGVWLFLRWQRTDRLRKRFGPEYERTARESGDVRRAEAELEARAKRVAAMKIRKLSADDATRFTRSWRDVQRRFVDDPGAATAEADRLVGEVMNARGYPLGDLDQRIDDVSVDHAAVVSNYRSAREIANRHARGEASTEDLRQAFVHYRTLFTELLEAAPEPAPAERALAPERERELTKERR